MSLWNKLQRTSMIEIDDDNNVTSDDERSAAMSRSSPSALPATKSPYFTSKNHPRHTDRRRRRKVPSVGSSRSPVVDLWEGETTSMESSCSVSTTQIAATSSTAAKSASAVSAFQKKKTKISSGITNPYLRNKTNRPQMATTASPAAAIMEQPVRTGTSSAAATKSPATTSITATATVTDPDLNDVLQKLRPFQRQAYDLATRNLDPKIQTSSLPSPPKAAAAAMSNTYHRYPGTTKWSSTAANKQQRGEFQTAITTTTTRANSGQPAEQFTSSASSSSSSNTRHARVGNGRVFLCDEMGLGKSITSLAIMLHYRTEWPLLILCPASLRHTWPAEIEKFVPRLPPSAIYVVQGFDDADFFENPNKRKQIQIVIATYSLLQDRSAAARVLQQFQFRCVIVDESHNLKQKNSQRASWALPLLQMARRLVLLSGTPALARPVELWTQVHALAPHLFATSYTAYTKQYCNAHHSRFGRYDVNGSSNAPELHAKLQQIMVRRLKADVLDDLPAKQRSVVPMSMGNNNNNKTTISKTRKECERILRDLRDKRKSIDDLFRTEGGEEAAMGAHFEARTLLMEAYQASGVAKAESVCDYLLEWLRGSSTTEKVLIFGHHKAVLDTIEVAVAKELKGAGHIRIDGTVNSQERAVRVKKFQTSPQVRVAILSMTAAGVGLTLTAASNVMFAELHWTPGVLAQAEDRCHRIGQRNAVHVMYLVCEDKSISVDMDLWDMIGRKVNNLGQVIDGEDHSSLDVVRHDKQQPGHTEGGSSRNGAGRQSMRDELQSFFAENASGRHGSNASTKTPVKGTITSFFGKQKLQNSPGDANTTKITPATPSTSSTATKISRTLGDPSNTTTAISSRAAGKLSWDCKLCTFINLFVRNDCAMCGTAAPKLDEGGTDGEVVLEVDPLSTSSRTPTTGSINPVTPHSTKKKISSIDRHSSVDLSSVKAKRQRCHSAERNGLERTGSVHSTGSFLDETGRQTSDSIIVIDDDEVNTCIKQKCKLTPSRPSDEIDTIVLDDISAGSRSTSLATITTLRACNSPARKKFKSAGITPGTKQGPTVGSASKENKPLLLFSVSKNSGRIMIHYGATLESSLVSFDLEQCLTEEASDQMMEAKLNRKHVNGLPLFQSLDFENQAIEAVTRQLDINKLDLNRTTTKMLVDEIKAFVNQFVALREIEKKALKESGATFSGAGANLRQQVLLQQTRESSQSTSTERYLGGAKEHAQRRMELGTATADDLAVLEGRRCAYCAGDLSAASQKAGVISTYCSQECAEDGRLKRGGMFASSRVRTQMFALEGGVCRLCGIDAHSLYTRIASLAPAERLNALCNANWKLPKAAKSLERLLQNPKEGDFWQADHIQAVAEGGGGCGLENLRTLCVPCHILETEKLRGRLKLMGPSSSSQGDEIRSRQTDIRSLLWQK